MSDAKYKRFNSHNIGEFAWTKTQYDKIIVRDKEDGEIILAIEKPLDQKTLIADSYHAGFNTAYSLRSSYIDFLEGLTAPLMPGYEEPQYEYEAEYTPVESQAIFVTDDHNDLSAQHCVYEIFISTQLFNDICEISAKHKVPYEETFCANACSVWIENETALTETDVYAAPKNGIICRVFLNKEAHESYKWLARQINHTIDDLLHTAIKEITRCMKLYKPDPNVIDIKEARKPKPSKTSKDELSQPMMTISASTV